MNNFAIAVAIAWLMTSAGTPNPSQEAERTMLAAAREVVAAAEGGRQGEIAARVSVTGFGCMDGMVTRADFAADLSTPGSWMHA